MKDTLYATLTKAGITTDNHESDLYFPVTAESAAILKTFPCECKISQTFPHMETGEFWFDVSFAYAPFWDAVARRVAHLSQAVKA